MKARYVILLLFLFSTVCSFSQKEAYNWYFGNKSALDFNTGIPSWFEGSKMVANQGTVSLSDTAGNLLFYSNGEKIWNRENTIMPNGADLHATQYASQPCVAIPYPGNPGQYFLFYVSLRTWPYQSGCRYSLIDMALDGGKGDVVAGKKNLDLPGSDSVQNIVFAIKHKSRNAYWMVTRSYKKKNFFLSYLIDYTGIHPVPVTSECMYDIRFDQLADQVAKFSPDGKYLVSAESEWAINHPANVELYSFNDITGVITPIFIFLPHTGTNTSHGAEFSANSEYLYLSNKQLLSNPWRFRYTIEQFDMSRINNIDLFENSGIELYSYESTDINSLIGFHQMQMGPDGKIYIARSEADSNKYLARINYPAQKGLSCGFEPHAVYLETGNSLHGLPTYIQSYFVKFNWKGNCLGDSTYFSSWFLPEPDNIEWDFGDPLSGSNNFSTLKNPSHLFSGFGNFNVTATAYFPDGKTEVYVREVIITPYPVFDLGEDITICQGNETTLASGVMLAQFLWNTGETTPSISVSEPGEYSLRVENFNGCIHKDTVNVSLYNKPTLEDTALLISPTTCGNATGAIRHLVVEGGDPPVNIQWLDQWGNVISTEPDITNLAVGKYYLTVGYGAGCRDTLADYTIVNFDSDLIIEDVVIEGNAHCNQPTGSLKVKVKEGLSDMLLYSVDGINYFANEGHFEGLSPGSYIVMVKDSEGCEAVYINNPVNIGNIDGPAINSVVITPETPAGNNGSIDFTVSGSDSLTYYLNGILQDTSFIEGLTAGPYLLSIEDEFGCQADTLIEVPYLQGNYLYAIADNDHMCLKAIASSQIRVSHVNGLKYLKATLSYDGSRLNCTHFNGSLDGIGAIVYPAQEMVVVEWQGLTSITSIDTIALGELIFETLQPGLADVNWQSPPGTVFTDENGNAIHPELIPGIIEVHPVPEVQLTVNNMVCHGDSINIVPQVTGGTDPVNLKWETPNGVITSPDIRIPNASPEHTGRYTLMLSDHFRCADTAEVNIAVIPPPQTNFPETPIPFENQYILEAPQGYASYEWSNGETNYFITVTEEGEYLVIIKTTEGCESRDTAMLVNVAVPVYVPNAFTPNGDGLNDTFKPIITKPDLVSQYHLSIYNRWGQCFFESSDPSKGWDGKEEVPGVYNWVVSYRDGMGKVNQLMGSVTLIK